MLDSLRADDESRCDFTIAQPAGQQLKDLRFTRHFYVVTHTGRSRSPLCQAFLDFLLAAGDGGPREAAR